MHLATPGHPVPEARADRSQVALARALPMCLTLTSESAKEAVVAATDTALLPLESGDRLTREEFHHRYSCRPDIRRAELIGGVVYVPSPMRFVQYDQPNTLVNGWLFTYRRHAPGVQQGSGGTIYLDDASEVQPDAYLFFDPPVRPNGVRRRADGYLEGTPELVVEVAASSAAYDLHDKLERYRRAGVIEYVAWQTLERRIDWFRLVGSAYISVVPDENGIIESTTFPGLRLHVANMLALDEPAVLAALRPPH